MHRIFGGFSAKNTVFTPCIYITMPKPLLCLKHPITQATLLATDAVQHDIARIKDQHDQ
jgi:hypothetical protein